MNIEAYRLVNSGRLKIIPKVNPKKAGSKGIESIVEQFSESFYFLHCPTKAKQDPKNERLKVKIFENKKNQEIRSGKYNTPGKLIFSKFCIAWRSFSKIGRTRS